MSIAHDQYRSPEFKQLRQYLIKMYGTEAGIKYYNEWLEYYGFNSSKICRKENYHTH